jgi:hypothetical protein
VSLHQPRELVFFDHTTGALDQRQEVSNLSR